MTLVLLLRVPSFTYVVYTGDPAKLIIYIHTGAKGRLPKSRDACTQCHYLPVTCSSQLVVPTENRALHTRPGMWIVLSRRHTWEP